MSTCHNKACQEEAVKTGLCAACYNRLRYWLAKKPRNIMRRRRQLARSEATLSDLAVPTIRKRKSP